MCPSAFKIVKIEHPLNKTSKLTTLIVIYWGRVEYFGVFICSEYFLHLNVTLRLQKLFHHKLKPGKLLFYGLV